MRHVGVERVGQIEPLEHRIAAFQGLFHPRRGSHRDALAVDPEHARLVGVEQAATVVAVGPADPVAGMDRQPLFLEQLQRIAPVPWPQPRGDQPTLVAAAIAQGDDASLAIDRSHMVAPRPELLRALLAVELDDQARLVGIGIAQLLARGADPHQRIDGERGLSQLAAGPEPGLDRLVDRAAQMPPRGVNRGLLACRRGKRQPGLRGGLRAIVADLERMGLEERQRFVDVATLRGGLRVAQHFVAGADIAAHHCGLGARCLDHRERLARIDRAQLLAIADRREPAEFQHVGETDELLLVGIADHRGLVEQDHRT